MDRGAFGNGTARADRVALAGSPPNPEASAESVTPAAWLVVWISEQMRDEEWFIARRNDVQAQGAYEVLHEMNPRRWESIRLAVWIWQSGSGPFWHAGPVPVRASAVLTSPCVIESGQPNS
jgi:hypothetical protein